MRIYRKLYVSASLRGRERTVLRKIRRGKVQVSCYVIVLSEKEGEQLEIYHAAMFHQRLFRETKPLIVGLASGEQDAYELVMQIAEEVYEKTNTLNIKQYILERVGRV